MEQNKMTPETWTKQAWPELLLQDGEHAKDVILEENPNLEVYLVPVDYIVTSEVNKERVRIRVDEDGMVTKTPVRG
ncbi:subtilisin-chymotrypsin inhibitor-2B-like [Haliotis rubra]|uniref:subtilisin-chymotrypsin inhibitor-2B-like n=1 Tax=Haliotis rubra TaxID=36100 RepID=UPI001EE50695|nr:subtilisin-chymotrypsin inhibitor-2B-like [Haliotis rubra]